MSKKEEAINSLEYLSKKIKYNELPKIFKRSLDRELFISEYCHFGLDGNNKFYKDFVETYIYNNRSKLQIDAIELSISINYYKKEHLHVIENIIFSKRNEWIKLLCADWIFNFRKMIPSDKSLVINRHLFQSTTNELIQIQSLLNLLDNSEGNVVESLKQYFNRIEDVASYYRVINVLKSETLTKPLVIIINNILLELVNDNIKLAKTVRIEILTQLKNIVDPLLPK